MKYIFVITGIILLLLFSSAKSYSQCCAAGNPVSSNSSFGASGKDILSVNLSHIFSLSDTYYNGSNKLNKEYIQTKYNFTYLALSYGLTDKLRVNGDIGYFINKSQLFVKQDYERYAQGIADLNFGLSFDTYRSDDEEFGISQTIRTTIPIGEFQQVYDGIELPIDLQPSSGNFKVNLGLTLSKIFGESGFSLISVNSAEFSQFIETANTLYKYGNLYNLSIIGKYVVTENISGLLQFRAEIRERALNNTKSESNSYSYINSTGGVIGFISPQLNYSFDEGWMASLQFNYPLIKNVYGEQLTNKYFIMAGISKSFDFSSDNDDMDEDFEDEKPQFDPNLFVKSIRVEGLCEMCKNRIEKTGTEFPFVEGVFWNAETKMLDIYYANSLPDITAIQKALADKGHDNDMFKSDDKVYERLPLCCHYREDK